MTSILTNTSAMAALSTLRSISSDMESTQGRISSGLKVGTASDNAAYWSIATTMRSDNAALSSVQDALGLGAAKVDTAYAGMESAIEVVEAIKTKLVAATEDGVDKTKIQEEIDQLKEQLTAISQAASFTGENWLQADIENDDTVIGKSVVASFVRDDNGNVSVKKVDYNLSAKNVLFDTSGNNNGILDKTYDVAGNSADVNVNINGSTKTYNVAAVSMEDLIASGAEFTTNTITNADGTTTTTRLATAANAVTTELADGSTADVIEAGEFFVQVDEDTWVKAVVIDATDGQQVAHTDGTDSYGIDINHDPLADAAAPTSIANIDIRNISAADLDSLISGVDAALTDMTSAAAQLGSLSSRIDMQTEFAAKLSDSIDAGVGRLVDADMNEESTRLKALQTQQQLAIQALSIANSDSQNVLSLFR